MQAEATMTDKCATCGKDGIGLKGCSGCKSVRYCNVSCQKSHWNMHKKACKKITAASKKQQQHGSGGVAAAATSTATDLKLRHQDDPNNIYQRWRWDEKFCSPEIHGKALTQKMMCSMMSSKPMEVVDLVCEKAVQIAMRMIRILLDGNEVFWPWGDFIQDFKLEAIGNNRVEAVKEMYGTTNLAAIVAHMHPETSRVIGVDYTKDYAKTWESREPGGSLPICIIDESSVIERLDPTNINCPYPCIPELKDLSVDLLVLFGHPKELAEGWIQVGSEGELLTAPIGVEAIFSALYAAFTVMSEGRSDENDKPDVPKFDDEPLDQFRSDLKVFIDDLNYNHHSLTIGDLMG